MKYFLLVSLLLISMGCLNKDNEGKVEDCESNLKKIEINQDTTVTLSLNKKVRIGANSPLFLTFTDAFEGCSSDICRYCDTESKIYLEISDGSCVGKVPYFMFLKCGNSNKVSDTFYSECKWVYGEDAHLPNSVYGGLIFSMLEFSPYSETETILKEHYRDKSVYKIKLFIKKRCN